MMSEVSTIGHFKIEPVFLNGTLLELVLSFKCSPSQLVSKVKDTKVFAATSQLPHFASTAMKCLWKTSEEAVALRQKFSFHLL